MERISKEIIINAPVSKVWNTMLEKDTYKIWTKAFSPDSSYEGSWEKGCEIRFTDGSGNGMWAVIADNIPNKFISIAHKGELKNGTHDTSVQVWDGAFENYTFSEENGKTKLVVELTQIPTEMKAMFEDMWPKALLKLKEISEEEMKDCDYKCESCLMPLGKKLEDAGTEKDGSKSTKYCKYCYQNGELCYKGNDLKEFQAIVYKAMTDRGMWKPKAKFFTWMIKFAPRWKGKN